MRIKIGIIGGSGLEHLDILKDAHDVNMTTRWGDPSSPLIEGVLRGVAVVLLARHGRAHTLTPSAVNYRANVQAMKDAGCTHLLATTAVGSLREEIKRGDLIIVDQFIDFAKKRQSTFYEEFEPNNPKHTAMADPFDSELRQLFIECCRKRVFSFHKEGMVVSIEGPRFSTRAESHMFRAWGADIINMSVATEAALANEAGIPYAVVAMATDYDCWKTDEAPVSWEQISTVFKSNAEKVTTLLVDMVEAVGALPQKA